MSYYDALSPQNSQTWPLIVPPAQMYLYIDTYNFKLHAELKTSLAILWWKETLTDTEHLLTSPHKRNGEDIHQCEQPQVEMVSTQNL